MSSSINYEHLAAIITVGIAGIILISTGHNEAGTTLLGGLLGYAFKNGIKTGQQ